MTSDRPLDESATVRSLKNGSLVLLASVAAIWAASLYGLADKSFLYQMALVPRRVDGLAGVLTMPFVHQSMSHLVLNTVPLAVLGGLVVLRGARYFALVSLAILAAGGLLVWGFARPGLHVGASGLVFGYFGFLLVRGVYDRQLSSALVALVVVFLYGGMFWGILPGGDGTSWESHLYGLLAGGVIARFWWRGKGGGKA
ncbi:MAG: rhomboid family intramembrane serine protease [Gammaproteobacteria bacterium]|nr:rhomboid family intramembrane serine protease [Gammaproteobacteria bacterium]